MMKIIIYTKKGCPWTKGVREMFAEKGVEYEERDILLNKNFLDEIVAKSGQSKSPTLDIDGEILPDTDREAVAVFLKAKGHIKFI